MSFWNLFLVQPTANPFNKLYNFLPLKRFSWFFVSHWSSSFYSDFFMMTLLVVGTFFIKIVNWKGESANKNTHSWGKVPLRTLKYLKRKSMKFNYRAETTTKRMLHNIYLLLRAMAYGRLMSEHCIIMSWTTGSQNGTSQVVRKYTEHKLRHCCTTVSS